MSGLWRIAVLLAALSGAGQAVAAEVIHSFDSDVLVAKDGELSVTETLRVRAEGRASTATSRSCFAMPAAACAR
jgi:hypothetical protein